MSREGSSEDPASPVRASPQAAERARRWAPREEQDEGTEEATELLQQLIRNRCVNDGTPGSGYEIRSVDTLRAFFGDAAATSVFEPAPGRASLVLRVEGTDPAAPTLALLGHLDVVPADPEGWTRDPFGGELIDGEVWGRGAADMLGITATMAVATKRLLAAGRRPRGTLLYVAVADEEARGIHGAEWLVEREWDAVRCDHLITELGGARLPLGNGARPVFVAEKGSHWTRLRVGGVPGHGSAPYGADNAVVKMAEVVRRIGRYRPPAVMHETWLRFVRAMDLPRVQAELLTRGPGVELALGRMPLAAAKMVHAATHTTFSPNVTRGGVKLNVIPDSAEVDIDIRTLPGVDGAGVRMMLRDAIGDLWSEVRIVDEGDNPATASPIDTPMWDVLARQTARLVPGARTAPFIFVAATDARFFRRKGVTCYGYGLFSDRIPFPQLADMFHGRNERIDQESLRLMVGLWEGTATELLA